MDDRTKRADTLWPTPLGKMPLRVVSEAEAACGDAAEKAAAEGCSIRVAAREGARAYAAILAREGTGALAPLIETVRTAQGEAEYTKAVAALLNAIEGKEPERTPAVVLEAMLRSYEEAAKLAMVAHYQAADGQGEGAWARFDELDDYVDELRAETAHLLAGYPGPDLTYPAVVADYEARLSGTWPLHGPPKGTSS